MKASYFLFWLPMILIAFANATLRELLLVRYYSNFRAQQYSTLSLILFCSIYVWAIFPKLRINSTRQAFQIGFLWVLLTVLFEFSLGRFSGKSWEFLFRNYDILSGRLWLLFLIWLLLLPFGCLVIRKNPV